MCVKQNDNRISVNLNKEIGRFIRQLRVSNSLSGKEFGRLVNLSQQQISRYENGVTCININTLNTLLVELNTDWSEFYKKVLHIDVNNCQIKY
ncbi:TPA: helix-turn-helix transcriptional regulator [Providencia stuartii]|nr:helix-turn-helix transcriptional regulator [Providencia stuartii]